MRKQHRKQYWEEQTQIENAYIENFKQERLVKQKADLDNWRTAICNISMNTKKKLVRLLHYL